MERVFDDRYSYNFEKSFNYVWDTVIWPVIKSVEEDMEDEFKQAANLSFSYQDQSKYKEEIKAFYREKRDWLKDVYLPHEEHPYLDEHKLGAIWCRTILAFKPFYFDLKAVNKYIKAKFDKPIDTLTKEEMNNSEWFTKNVYCNYRVAFLVSVGIVYLYLLYNCKEKNEDLVKYLHDAYDYFRDKKTLRCPLTSSAHNNFITSCIIALQKNDTLNRDFDYLTYAIMLFQLEHYNRICYFVHKNGLSIEEI